MKVYPVFADLGYEGMKLEVICSTEQMAMDYIIERPYESLVYEEFDLLPPFAAVPKRV